MTDSGSVISRLELLQPCRTTSEGKSLEVFVEIRYRHSEGDSVDLALSKLPVAGYYAIIFLY